MGAGSVEDNLSDRMFIYEEVPLELFDQLRTAGGYPEDACSVRIIGGELVKDSRGRCFVSGSWQALDCISALPFDTPVQPR